MNNQIFTPPNIKRIQKLINAQPNISRNQLSREVCQLFNWRSANDSLKEVSCRTKLLKLHRRGKIRLPEARKTLQFSKIRQKVSALSYEPQSMDCELPELGKVKLLPVSGADRDNSRLWNSLMERYHYLGAGPLCGAQLRYLIESSQRGIVGGLSFSAAAWRLEARDRWIGWDDLARRNQLNKVVCNSRFLILPTVQVKNLASHVLGLAVKQLPGDWYQKYRIKPALLETFVDPIRFKGTCYQAANWLSLGQTNGRGRQDSKHECRAGVKDIYLYPLSSKAKELLCEGRLAPVIAPKQPVDWAEQEFGRARLGDDRRLKRLLTIARDFKARPQANIPQACQSLAKTKAAYRFLEDANNTMDKILAPHYESTLNRIHQEKVVLAVQDTTTLNYSAHPATRDLGPIGTKKEGLVGLIVHDTMCFTTSGLPLGLLDVQVWARNPADFGKRHLRYQLAIEQKESNKWLKSFSAAQKAQLRHPKTMVVSVGDREADIYELFLLAQSDPSGTSAQAGTKLLVRAERDRLLSDGQTHLWKHVASLPVSGIKEILIPRQKNKAARLARLEIRFAQVTLKPPKRKPQLSELTVWAILAQEIDYPSYAPPLRASADRPVGETPLQWMLLTNVPVSTFEQADEKVTWYCRRWGIEVYHRTLKSGCKIEERQLGAASRIEACLAIDMVVAWRIFHLTKLGRETPDMPCTVCFDDDEWKALVAYRTGNPVPPSKPPLLREFKRWVAELGGFLGRKSDGEPGTQTLWLGLQRLADIKFIWKICFAFFQIKHCHSPPVSSAICG